MDIDVKDAKIEEIVRGITQRAQNIDPVLVPETTQVAGGSIGRVETRSVSGCVETASSRRTHGIEDARIQDIVKGITERARLPQVKRQQDMPVAQLPSPLQLPVVMPVSRLAQMAHNPDAIPIPKSNKQRQVTETRHNMAELPPPSLTDVNLYEGWRSEIHMWQITTTMEPRRQALAVRTKLCDQAREVALRLDAADLNNESGMSFLIEALDKSFRKKSESKWDPPVAKPTDNLQTGNKNSNNQDKNNQNTNNNKSNNSPNTSSNLNHIRSTIQSNSNQSTAVTTTANNNNNLSNINSSSSNSNNNRGNSNQNNNRSNIQSSSNNNKNNNKNNNNNNSSSSSSNSNNNRSNNNQNNNRSNIQNSNNNSKNSSNNSSSNSTRTSSSITSINTSNNNSNNSSNNNNNNYQNQNNKTIDNSSNITNYNNSNNRSSNNQSNSRNSNPNFNKSDTNEYNSNEYNSNNQYSSLNKPSHGNNNQDSSGSNNRQNNGYREGLQEAKTAELSPAEKAEKARQRAAELTAKLTAEGKVNPMNPVHVPPPQTMTPSQLVYPGQQLCTNPLPEVKKNDSGVSYAEYIINDVAARPFLTKMSTRDLIAQKSGTAVSLRGRYMGEEEKQKAVAAGSIEKPLYLMIQANVAAKVQVAIHKITEVCRNYEATAPNSSTNYGLTDDPPSGQHFVQHKLWIGVEPNVPPEFNLNMQLAGENGSNLSFIIQQTGAKVFLRGQGSGYLEPNSGRESFEALHLYISHPRQDGLTKTIHLCESLVNTVKAQYVEWKKQRSASHAQAYPPYHAPYPPPNGYATQPPPQYNRNIPPSQQQPPQQQYPRQQQPPHPYRPSPSAGPENYTRLPPPSSSSVGGYGGGGAPPVTAHVMDYREQHHPPQQQQHGMGGPGYVHVPPLSAVAPPGYQPSNSRESTSDERSGHQSHDRGRERDRDYDDDDDERDRSRSERRRRSRSQEDDDDDRRERKRSPDSPRRKSSRDRDDSPSEPKPKKKSTRWGSPPPNRSSPLPSSEGYRDSPNRSPSRKDRDRSPGRTDSPRRKNRGDSPSVDSPARVSEEPKERVKRKFTEEPKKPRRKFSEDPRLIEQTKEQLAKREKQLQQQKEEKLLQLQQLTETSTIMYPSIEALSGEKSSTPKLQFRTKKKKEDSPPVIGDVKKPKSILKMAPPANLPMPARRNGSSGKSVKIGGSTEGPIKPVSKDDAIFDVPPLIPSKVTVEPPKPQKPLSMGALSSIAMYDDDSDDD